MNGRPDYPPRPPSEQLVDLHVYLVPAELWRDHLQSAVNQIINDTVSAGFIRVLPETTIYAMRSDLENQLDDMLPRDYVFLKSVGRCLARIRPKQEYQLKAKNFLPPQAYSPEIFILEVSPEVRATFPPSGASSERSDSRPAPNSSDPYSHYRPIPPIKNGSSSGYPYNGDPHSGETARTPGDSTQTPLSASPPNSPIPGETKPVRSPSAGDYRSQQGEGYLPPLSATPPHTPDTSKYRLTNGADAGLDDLERRRMDEMYRNDERNNSGNMDRNNAGNMDRNNAGNMDRNNSGNMDRNYAGNTERNGAGNITRNITGNDHRAYEGENQGKSASSSQDLSNQQVSCVHFGVKLTTL